MYLSSRLPAINNTFFTTANLSVIGMNSLLVQNSNVESGLAYDLVFGHLSYNGPMIHSSDI